MSVFKPKNLVQLEFTICLWLRPIYMSNSSWFIVVNCKWWVFFKFSVSKLVLNHLLTSWNVLFIYSGLVTIMLVSSAYKKIFAPLIGTLVISFMYRRNKKRTKDGSLGHSGFYLCPPGRITVYGVIFVKNYSLISSLKVRLD